MTRVLIEIDADNAGEARRQMLLLLGNTPATFPGEGDTSIDGHKSANPDLYKAVAEEILNPIKVPDQPITDEEADELVRQSTATKVSTRERGKPSPGHKRRTNAEIAEDEAADKADAERASSAADDTPAISTGGQRIDPDNPDDVAADEADEAADTAVSNGGKLTHDNLRDIMATYVKAYGLPAAQEDVPKVFSGLFGADVVKVSQVPEDRIAEAIEAVKKAGRENTYERTALAVA